MSAFSIVSKTRVHIKNNEKNTSETIQEKLKTALKQQPNENSVLTADDTPTNNLSV